VEDDEIAEGEKAEGDDATQPLISGKDKKVYSTIHEKETPEEVI